MKNALYLLIAVLSNPLLLTASPQTEAALNAYFEALDAGEFARAASMISPPEQARLQNIWTVYVISALDDPATAAAVRGYSQGERPRTLERIDSQESLTRFLRFAIAHPASRHLLQPPANYAIKDFDDSDDFMALRIRYDTSSGYQEDIYRFGKHQGQLKLLLPDTVLRAAQAIAQSLRGEP